MIQIGPPKLTFSRLDVRVFIPCCSLLLSCGNSGTFCYFYERQTPWRHQLTNATSANVSNIPGQATQPIKDLISSCIAYESQTRPEIDVIFSESLGHLDDEDLALASIATQHTLSDFMAQDERRSNVPGPNDKSSKLKTAPSKPEGFLATFAKSLASMTLTEPGSAQAPLEQRSRTEEDTPVSKSTQRPQQRSFNESKDEELDQRMTTSSAKPHESTSLPHPVTVSREMGSGNAHEITGLIGNLVIDFERHPPRESKRTDLARNDITRVVLAADLQFQAVHSNQIAPIKRNKLSKLGLGRDRSAASETIVEIEADRCEEYLIPNYEEELDGQSWGKYGQHHSERTWIRQKEAVKKETYVVISYLVYLNARVRETISGGKSGKGPKSGAGISNESGNGLPNNGSTSSTSSSNAGTYPFLSALR